jgi:uncharacterized membrane protein
MIIYSLASILQDKFGIMDFNLFLINLIFAVILFLSGLALGWLIKSILKKIIEKAQIEKTASKSFIHLFLTVIKWSVYLLFVSLALDQLGIPELTNWLSSFLVVIPAFVGALVLIVIGFAIAVYLRDLIEDSKILRWNILSIIVFYFVLYTFLVFALKTALIGQDKTTVNIIIIILTAIISFGVVYWHMVKKK